MLSIAPLSAGSARYYTGSSRQDYLSAGGEPPGIWLGSGAEALGLRGDVKPESLEFLFGGELDKGVPLVRNANADNRQVGWDLVFPLPKGCSIDCLVYANARRRGLWNACVMDAVATAMGYVERHLLYTRRGSQGRLWEPVKLVAAVFPHHTNRNLEPHVHPHVLVLNVGVRNDGTTGAISSRPLYDNKVLLGTVFEAALAQNVKRRLHTQLVRQGTGFDVKGIDRSVVEHFSTRGKEIKQRTSELGLTSRLASHIAAKETQRPKETMLRLPDLQAVWKQDARAMGFNLRRSRLDLPRWHGNAAHIINQAARELGRERGHFTLSALRIQALKVSVEYRVPVKEVYNSVKNYYLDSPEIKTIGTVRNEPILTTRRNHAVETAVIKAALAMQRTNSHGVSRQFVNGLLDTYRTSITWAQAETIRRVTLGPGGMRLLKTAPRADASFILDVARYIWELSGFQVVGATQSRKSAEVFQANTGINAVTVKDLCRHLEMSFTRKASIRIRNIVRTALHQKLIPPPFPQLTDRTVLVLYGARDIDAQRWLPIIERAHKAKALVVAVGEDTRAQSDLPLSVFKSLSVAIGGPLLPAEKTGPILGRSESRAEISQSQDVSRSENEQQRRQEASLQTTVTQNKAVAKEEAPLQKDDMASTLQRLLSQIHSQQRVQS